MDKADKIALAVVAVVSVAVVFIAAYAYGRALMEIAAYCQAYNCK